jgi:hypothetical protein
LGRIAVRVAKKDSNRVYAEIETGDGVPQLNSPGQLGQLWRSNDGGENWEMFNSDRQLRGRTHYYTRTEIAPDNENEVFFFSASFSRTLDGGHSLTKMPSDPGGDNHEMWIDPTNGDRMAVVNDGGVNISVDRGNSWNHVSLPIAQMYHVTVDDQIPYFVYGNRQDGPSWRGPSNSLQFGGFAGNSIPRGAWHPVAGGESGFAIPDPFHVYVAISGDTDLGTDRYGIFRLALALSGWKVDQELYGGPPWPPSPRNRSTARERGGHGGSPHNRAKPHPVLNTPRRQTRSHHVCSSALCAQPDRVAPRGQPANGDL